MPRNDVRLTGYLYDENNIDTSIAGYHKVAWYVHYTESDAWKLHKVQQYHEGDEIVEPETPVAPEHLELDFDKWGEYPETMPDHDVSVYGTFKYREKSFKVYYWLRDGGDLTGVTTRLHYETTCQYGVRHTLIPLIETPEGKKLDGWYWHRFDIYDQTNPYSAKRYGEDFIMPYKDVNIYCDIWDADADVAIPGYYRINWMLQYSEVSRQSTNTALFKREFLRENDSIIDPSIDPTYPVESAGMIFDYWEEHPETMPAANIEIWGHFKYNHLAHNIVYKYVDVATNQEVTFDTSTCVGGQQYSFATAKPADVSGYIFDGWYFKRQQVFGFEQGVYHAGPTRLGYSYCKDVSTITMPDNDVYVWGEYLDDDTQWDVPGYHKVIYTRRLPKGATAQNPESEITMQWKFDRFKEGDTITYATAPVINHYTATAWHLEDTTQTLPTVMGTEDVYVFCEYNYAFNTHNVIYKYGYQPDALDSSVYRTVECTEGSTYTFITEKPAAPEGYLIEGWYFPRQQVFGFETGTHFAGNHIGCSYTADVPQIRMPDNDVLVYCKYVQNTGQDLPGYYKLKYIVTYPPGATSQNPEIWWTSTFKTEQYQQGDTITYATGPTVGHYTFTGWHLEDTTQTLPTTMGSEDITVYGTFTYAANTHNVTYKYGFTPDAADSSVYRTVQVQEGSQYSWITDKPAPPEGYLIEGWYFKRQQVFGFQPGSYSAGTHIGCSYCVDVPTITMPDNDVEAYCQYVADSGQDLPGYYKLRYYTYCPPGSDAYHPETWYTKLLKTEQYEAGATITYATAPTIAHYNFSGWHLEDGSSVLPTVMPSNDLVVKGEYSYAPATHNVIYQYGTNPEAADASIFRTVQVTEGSTYSWINEYPTYPEGYIGDGWYFKRQQIFGQETGTHYAGTHLGCSYCTEVPQVIMPDRDVYVLLQLIADDTYIPISGYHKAYWMVRYTDTMYWMTHAIQNYREGQTIVPPSDPSPYTYYGGQLVFDHWAAYPSVMGTSDLTIEGYFRAVGEQYKVTYNIVTVPESGPRQYESYVTYWEARTPFVADPRPPIKEGYYWDGWQGVPEVMPTHDVVITGYYYPGSEEEPVEPTIYYQLKYYDSDRTSLITTQQYEEGDEITAYTQPNKLGYRKDGWNGLPADMLMPPYEVRVYAIYTKVPTVVYYRESDFTGLFTSQTYNIGDTIVPPTGSRPAKTGYTFSGWGGLPQNMTITTTDTLKSYAIWKKNVKIEYYVDSTLHYTQNLLEGDSIVVRATDPTKEGYIFTGWSGLPENMIMPANDVTATANFSAAKQVTYYAKWQAVSGAVSTYPKTYPYQTASDPYATQLYYAGQTITPSLPDASDEFEFYGWEGMPQDMIMPDSNITVYAVYNQKTYTVRFNLPWMPSGSNYYDYQYKSGEIVSLANAWDYLNHGSVGGHADQSEASVTIERWRLDYIMRPYTEYYYGSSSCDRDYKMLLKREGAQTSWDDSCYNVTDAVINVYPVKIKVADIDVNYNVGENGYIVITGTQNVNWYNTYNYDKGNYEDRVVYQWDDSNPPQTISNVVETPVNMTLTGEGSIKIMCPGSIQITSYSNSGYICDVLSLTCPLSKFNRSGVYVSGTDNTQKTLTTSLKTNLHKDNSYNKTSDYQSEYTFTLTATFKS